MNTELIDLRVEEQTSDDLDYALNEGYYKEIKQYARQLGLQGQIELTDEHIRKLRGPKILTPCLSRQDLLIWQEFLPTSYRGTVSKPVPASRRLSSYRFDLIPKHIYQQWVEWDNSLAFEEFEIRTEEELLDPALFGIRDGKYWLLARWGASDEMLISFEEIKKLLRERLADDRRSMGIVAGVFLAGSLLLFWPVMNALRGVEPLCGLGMAGPAIFVLLFAVLCWKGRD